MAEIKKDSKIDGHNDGEKNSSLDLKVLEFLKHILAFSSNCTKCLKNQPCDVIKIGEMRGEVGKKTPQK